MNPLIEAGTKYTAGNVKRRDLAVDKVNTHGAIRVENPTLPAPTVPANSRLGLRLFPDTKGGAIELISNGDEVTADTRCTISACLHDADTSDDGTVLYLRPIDPGAGWIFRVRSDGEDRFQVLGNRIQLPPSYTPPTASASGGLTGQMAWDGEYVYVCVDTNTWKRAALSTWS